MSPGAPLMLPNLAFEDARVAASRNGTSPTVAGSGVYRLIKKQNSSRLPVFLLISSGAVPCLFRAVLTVAMPAQRGWRCAWEAALFRFEQLVERFFELVVVLDGSLAGCGSLRGYGAQRLDAVFDVSVAGIAACGLLEVVERLGIGVLHLVDVPEVVVEAHLLVDRLLRSPE